MRQNVSVFPIKPWNAGKFLESFLSLVFPGTSKNLVIIVVKECFTFRKDVIAGENKDNQAKSKTSISLMWVAFKCYGPDLGWVFRLQIL